MLLDALGYGFDRFDSRMYIGFTVFKVKWVESVCYETKNRIRSIFNIINSITRLSLLYVFCKQYIEILVEKKTQMKKIESVICMYIFTDITKRSFVAFL